MNYDLLTSVGHGRPFFMISRDSHQCYQVQYEL